MRTVFNSARLRTTLLAFATAGVLRAAAATSLPELPRPIAALVEALGPTAQAAIWFGPPEGHPALTWHAARAMPAASAIKVGHLIEVCAARASAGTAGAPGWTEPLPETIAVLGDAAHPAVAHFSPAQRATARRLLGERSTLGLCEAMISGRDVDNAPTISRRTS